MMHREGLEIMLAELESSCLEVVLVPTRRPSNEGGMIRVAVSKNAAWYRAFCARHASGRIRAKSLPDTRIKRRSVIRILTRLTAGLPSRSKYVFEFVQLAAKIGANRKPLEARA